MQTCAKVSAGLIIADNIFVMLLEESYFKSSIQKELCDATRSTEVLVCLSCDSRQQVDDTVAMAVAAGGTSSREPKDHGFMYIHAFDDLDGHTWELAYMEPGAQG